MVINCLPRPSLITDCFLWLTRSSAWPRRAHFQPRKPSTPWAAVPKALWPASFPEGGDCAPCSAMVTSHLACCTQLWDPKIRTWTRWSKYSGDYKAAQWAGAPLPWTDAELELASLEKRKLWGDLRTAQGDLQESWRGTCDKGMQWQNKVEWLHIQKGQV